MFLVRRRSDDIHIVGAQVRFTVGIQDDLSFLSLPPSVEIDILPKGIADIADVLMT